MEVMPTVYRYGDPKCRSDRGDNVLQQSNRNNRQQFESYPMHRSAHE